MWLQVWQYHPTDWGLRLSARLHDCILTVEAAHRQPQEPTAMMPCSLRLSKSKPLCSLSSSAKHLVTPFRGHCSVWWPRIISSFCFVSHEHVKKKRCKLIGLFTDDSWMSLGKDLFYALSTQVCKDLSPPSQSFSMVDGTVNTCMHLFNASLDAPRSLKRR